MVNALYDPHSLDKLIAAMHSPKVRKAFEEITKDMDHAQTMQPETTATILHAQRGTGPVKAAKGHPNRTRGNRRRG